MSSMTLVHRNGSKPHIPASARLPMTQEWLQQTTQSFFGAFNWDDNPPEVQELKRATIENNGGPLSLTLSVGQFFATINWDDSAIAKPPTSPSPLSNESDVGTASPFTLEDFSDLF